MAAHSEFFCGSTSPCLGLSSPWQQQRCPSSEGGVSADGWRGSLLRSGLPQLVLSHFTSGQQKPGDQPGHGGLLWERSGLLPHLQPGRWLSALQQLWLWRGLRFRRVRLWRICFLAFPANITNVPVWRILLTWALLFENHSSFLFDLVCPGCAPQVNHSWSWLPLKVTVWYLLYVTMPEVGFRLKINEFFQTLAESILWCIPVYISIMVNIPFVSF